MKKQTRTWAIYIVIIIVIIAGFYIYSRGKSSYNLAVTTADYACNAGKTISVAYYLGPSKPATGPDMPPTPGGSVALTLSDGRKMTLPQTISADGDRYANSGETIVFWNVGNTVTFTENGQETYTGCIEVAKDPGGLGQVYTSSAKGFSLRYPTGFTVDEAYSYQELGPGKDISGVKFTIPASLATGTNLSNDSYLSVEEIPQTQTQTCDASLFLDLQDGATSQTLSDGDLTYSVASSTGAGAGNRYAETVYAIPGTSPCVAVRYLIHYGVIENYPAGTIKEFDMNAITNLFDNIRRTLVLQH